MRHYVMRYGGPVGLTESDDMENWNYAFPASLGTIAQRCPTTSRWVSDTRIPMTVCPGMTLNYRIAEENQRSRLNRWLDFMEAEELGRPLSGQEEHQRKALSDG